ncbi:MAG: uncharacterized protein K0R38_3447 [Polyangiaceae bacterium]|jgi:hypothetical protein|nr:uncharacterized protein [Polyangiaceae bacterium]
MRQSVRFGVGSCLLVALGGCARGPDVASPELPLRRVVVYRNGVGYFERGGQVEGEQVSFKMRQRMVGDFLATLAIVERGGSSLKAASFPLEVDKDDPVARDPRFSQMLDAWNRPGEPPKPPEPPSERLRKVLLRLDGKEHDLAVGYVATTPLWRPSYRVVVSQGGGADLQVWGIVQNLSGEDWKNVELTLVAGAPIAFESTLGDAVTPARPVITDTGEIIAQVPVGMTTLGQQPGGVVDRYAPTEPTAPAAEAEAPADKDEGYGYEFDDAKANAETSRASSGGSGRGVGAARPKKAMPASAPAPAPPPPPPSVQAAQRAAVVELNRQGLSAPRRLSALAAVAVGGGTTRYRIPGQVTVPDESATMVLLVSRKVPGESVFLFSPDSGVSDSSAHPFRVVRFENATTGLLERGPIAVFGEGQFLGQGMLDPLPPQGKATVPFALDRSVAVSRERASTDQGARLFRIEAGALYIERDSVTKTTYKVVNGGDETSKLLIRHPRLGGARLFKPPAGTEDDLASASALVPIPLKPRGRAELVVDERQAVQQGLDWLHPLADEAVKAYLSDSRADRAVAQKLSEAWALRDALKKASDQVNALQTEQQELEKSSRETRLSLEAIEKNNQAADLRQKLTRRLAEVTTRLDQITKRLVELRLSLGEAQVRFKEAIREVKLPGPLPPKD